MGTVTAVTVPTGSAPAVQANNLATGCAWAGDTGCSFTAAIPPPLAGDGEVFVQVEAVRPTQPVVTGALSAPT